MSHELKTAPAGEPLTLAETQEYLKTNDLKETDWIISAIQAVRENCEAYTRRALMTQTWVLWLDAFKPGSSRLKEIEIPKPPLQSITHVTTYGADDSATPFEASRYLVDTASTPGRLILRKGQCWSTDMRIARSIQIEFVAGYGGAAYVPAAIRQGMLLWIRLLYADKTWLFDAGAPVQGLPDFNRGELPLPVRALWDPYRLPRLG